MKKNNIIKDLNKVLNFMISKNYNIDELIEDIAYHYNYFEYQLNNIIKDKIFIKVSRSGLLINNIISLNANEEKLFFSYNSLREGIEEK